MDAWIVCVGSELTSGRVTDTNATRLASVLTQLGHRVSRCIAVSDERGELVGELARAFREADLVVVAGGLGPTGDDITRECVAEAAGVGLLLDPDAIDKLRRRFAKRGVHTPASNQRQALFPEGSARLENPIGTADGWSMKAGKATVFVLPGVPTEMEAMLPAVALSTVPLSSALPVQWLMTMC